MARRRAERPTFVPHDAPRPGGAAPCGPPPAAPPARPGKDPLRAMAPVFATLAAVGITALAVWLPLREAREESLKHYESTRYIDVAKGSTRVWHNVEWRMTSFRRIPWKYYTGASPPPKNFVRLHILVHARLLGPKARLSAINADNFLHSDLSGETFEQQIRDRDGRVWDPIAVSTDARQWPNYQPAKGMDLEIYADAPASKAGEAALVMKFEDHRDDFNVSKTPSPRETVLRFVR